MLCADKPIVGVRIVDTTWTTVPLAGEVEITVDTHARELLCGEGEQRLEVKDISVMNRPRWMLDLNWRRPAFPAVILIAMCLWVFPMGDFGVQLPMWLLTSLWLALALPLLLYRKRQLLAIELAADQGVLVVEADDEGTSLLLM